MVTLAGLEPATSPAPGEQGRSIPLELQRRHDLHDRLWRRRGGGIGSTPTTTEQGDARPPLPAALVRRGRVSARIGRLTAMARPPHIDCDQMSDDVREDLFMSSHDRLTDNAFKAELCVWL
jgi:hypothetical protein